MRNPTALAPKFTTLILALTVWSVLVLGSVLAQREQLNRTAMALARIDAVANLKKDMAIRKWASDVGGVFIRENKVGLESLDEEERVTATRNTGETYGLISVTSIHLLLAIQETSGRQFGIHERLTSNQLRNLRNAPDDWEEKALRELGKGSEMVTEAQQNKGGHGLMRVMFPMKMEQECLECHRDTLVPVGGLRGGATISIDLNTYRSAQEPTWRSIRYWHFGIWILGLAGIISFWFISRNRALEHARQEEEHRENERLTRARDQAEAANRSKSTFLANMSHELRTPLNAVIGFSQIMAKDRSLTPQQQRNVEIINASGTHLLTLINDILELSKIESGKMQMLPEEVCLSQLLAQVVSMMRIRAEQSGLHLQLTTDRLPEIVVLDPVMLRQILLNLLSNAVKFTPSGKVELRVSTTKVSEERSRLHFGVTDTGIGISPEDIQRIFHPFEQASGGHREGTGLGLTISQNYVGMMGGKLTVESTPGQGSDFQFEIEVGTCPETENEALPAPVSQVLPANHGLCALVVDDMPEARLLLRSLLEPFGFRVIEAADGETAIERAQDAQVDLILLDWFLPGKNGLEVIAHLRNHTTWHPSIIMLTANALSESRQQAMAAGADGFMSKPFQAEDLYALLETHLPITLIRANTETAPDTESVNIAGALANLPLPYRNRLEEAALSLDERQIALVLDEIAATLPAHQDFSSQLKRLCLHRQYSALWHLLGILEKEN